VLGSCLQALIRWEAGRSSCATIEGAIRKSIAWRGGCRGEEVLAFWHLIEQKYACLHLMHLSNPSTAAQLAAHARSFVRLAL